MFQSDVKPKQTNKQNRILNVFNDNLLSRGSIYKCFLTMASLSTNCTHKRVDIIFAIRLIQINIISGILIESSIVLLFKTRTHRKRHNYRRDKAMMIFKGPNTQKAADLPPRYSRRQNLFCVHSKCENRRELHLYLGHSLTQI